MGDKAPKRKTTLLCLRNAELLVWLSMLVSNALLRVVKVYAHGLWFSVLRVSGTRTGNKLCDKNGAHHHLVIPVLTSPCNLHASLYWRQNSRGRGA